MWEYLLNSILPEKQEKDLKLISTLSSSSTLYVLMRISPLDECTKKKTSLFSIMYGSTKLEIF
jgi:hypothetical protein